MRTLIVFAKEPRPGRVKTRLAASLGDEAACRIYRAFVADVARAARAVRETRVEWSVEGEPGTLQALVGRGAACRRQPEGDLGLRMARAFEEAFARGGGPVALVGTDCPLLTPSDFAALLSAVETGNDAALLPVEDGGYVGIALAGPAPEAFRGIPWSTGAVLGRTVEALERAGRRVRLLGSRYDVDTREDLERLAEDLRRAPGRAPETSRVLRALGETLGAREHATP